MESLFIAASQSYRVYFGWDLLCSSDFFSSIQKISSTCVIVSDDTVGALYAHSLQKKLSEAGFFAKTIFIPTGEKFKTRETKAWVEDQLSEMCLGQGFFLIALGGGVITDLVGFVAATYHRGIPVIYCPTSFLGMIDASIGGKTGVNTAYGKNCIGTITQPHSVWIDLTTLSTLPFLHYADGIIEMLKHALIIDADYWSLIQEQAQALLTQDPRILPGLLKKSITIKVSIIAKDENNKSLRHILNLGHTVGHALEHFSKYQLSHGRAVALGLIIEGLIAIELGFLLEQDWVEMTKVLLAFLSALTEHNINARCENYSLIVKGSYTRITLLEACRKAVRKWGSYTEQMFQHDFFVELLSVLHQDKKNRAHHISMVLLARLGCVAGPSYIQDISEEFCERAVKEFFGIMP